MSELSILLPQHHTQLFSTLRRQQEHHCLQMRNQSSEYRSAKPKVVQLVRAFLRH